MRLRAAENKPIPGPATYKLYALADKQKGTLTATLTSDGKGSVELTLEPSALNLDSFSLADAERLWGPRNNPDSSGPIVRYSVASEPRIDFKVELELANSGHPNHAKFSRNLKVVKYRLRSSKGCSSWIETRQGEKDSSINPTTFQETK